MISHSSGSRRIDETCLDDDAYVAGVQALSDDARKPALQFIGHLAVLTIRNRDKTVDRILRKVVSSSIRQMYFRAEILAYLSLLVLHVAQAMLADPFQKRIVTS